MIRLNFQLPLLLLLAVLSFGEGCVLVEAAGNESAGITVYVDPLYGGKEKGPVISKHHPSKQITLTIAEKLKNALNQKGIKVVLSRENDMYMSFQERLIKSRLSSSNMYIAISVNKRDTACINVLRPNPSNRGGSKKPVADVGDILDQLQRDSISSRSEWLAQIVHRNVTATSTETCVKISAKKVYLLENADAPTLIVEFGGIGQAIQSLESRKVTFVDDVVNALSKAVLEYFE